MKVLRALVIGLICTIWSACSSIDSESLSYKPLDKVVQTKQINMIGHWHGEGDRQKFVEDIIRVYEFKNQDVVINMKFPEEVYFDKEDRNGHIDFISNNIIENDNSWDILMINGLSTRIGERVTDPDWARNNLVDFMQYQEFKSNTEPGLITEQALKPWKGVAPGPFLEGQYYSLWVNKKVADKLGINVKQFGMTVDDFILYVKAVYDYNKSNPDTYIAPLYESYTWKTIDLLGLMMYASLLDAPENFFNFEMTNKRISAWGKTLDAFEELAPYNLLHKDWESMEWTSTQDIMLKDECLFYLNGSWMYNIWKGIDDEKVLDCMPTEFPGFKKQVVFPSTHLIPWCVPQNAKNKEEAIDFLLAINKPEVAEMWSRYTKCPTGITGNLSASNFGGDQYEVFSSYIKDEFGANTFNYYGSSKWVLDNAHANTGLRLSEVLTGRLTAEQAMAEIKRDIGWN